MEQLPSLGKAIQQVVLATFQIYTPLLQENAGWTQAPRGKRRRTFKYGPHERQELDVYYAQRPKLINGRQVVLLFEYGGGLVRGDKQLLLPGLPEGLVHQNVGAFFAINFRYTVVIADYRLIKHGAKFPSGGEDLALAVEWIVDKAVSEGDLYEEPIDLFIMGNSAGGVHLSTFLFHKDFAQTRQKISYGQETRLRGVILLSVPFNFASANEERVEILKAYFGDIDANSPCGQLRAAQAEARSLDFVEGGTRVLVLNGELDPEDEILQPRDDFVKQWLEHGNFAAKAAFAMDFMPGHNHISPVLGLGTGREREEAWGCQVAAFCDNTRKFAVRDVSST